MTSWTALAKLAAGPSGPESRTHPRFRANAMACERGTVLDFSATGIRIDFCRATRYRPGQLVDLTLNSANGALRCPVEVVWVKKTGWRSAEVGFRFPDPETARQLRLFQAAYDPLADSEWSNR